MARLTAAIVLSILLFLTSCASSTQAPDLPKMIPPDWQLGSVTPANMAAEPELLRNNARASWVVLYRGENTAFVRIYRLKSSANGMDVVQKWRPAPNSVVFYTPRYFVTVEWRVNDREAIRLLVAKLQDVLKH